jgi:hypothetical protein
LSRSAFLDFPPLGKRGTCEAMATTTHGREKRRGRKKIKERESRIVVCTAAVAYNCRYAIMTMCAATRVHEKNVRHNRNVGRWRYAPS